MDQRFSQESLKILGSFSVLQPSRFNMNLEDGLKHIDRLCSFYDLDCSATKSQYQLLLHHEAATTCTTAYEVLQLLRRSRLHSVYPNLHQLYRLMATIPVTTATCERSFSKLALIKNQLRSTMGQKRLEGLMILSVESDITECLSFEDVIKRFSVMAPRRSNFGHVEH